MGHRHRGSDSVNLSEGRFFHVVEVIRKTSVLLQICLVNYIKPSYESAWRELEPPVASECIFACVSSADGQKRNLQATLSRTTLLSFLPRSSNRDGGERGRAAFAAGLRARSERDSPLGERRRALQLPGPRASVRVGKLKWRHSPPAPCFSSWIVRPRHMTAVTRSEGIGHFICRRITGKICDLSLSDFVFQLPQEPVQTDELRLNTLLERHKGGYRSELLTPAWVLQAVPGRRSLSPL